MICENPCYTEISCIYCVSCLIYSKKFGKQATLKEKKAHTSLFQYVFIHVRKTIKKTFLQTAKLFQRLKMRKFLNYYQYQPIGFFPRYMYAFPMQIQTHGTVFDCWGGGIKNLGENRHIPWTVNLPLTLSKWYIFSISCLFLKYSLCSI